MQLNSIPIIPAVLLMGVVGFSSCTNVEDALPSTETHLSGQLSGTSSYIVKLKDNFSGQKATDQINRLVQKLGLGKKYQSALTGPVFNGFLAHLTSQDIEKLRLEPSVDGIELDLIAQPAGMNMPDSAINYTITPEAGQTISWGANHVGIGDGAATGRTAWIIDSGIQSSHPDLNVDVTRSKCFVSGTTSFEDQHGHGTNVAGILGAKNNNIGVVGIASGATLVSVRVLGANGTGTTSACLNGLNYVASNGASGDVVNYSINNGTSTMIDNAVIGVANKGLYVAIAAGNSSTNCATWSPQRVSHARVYTVSGLRGDGTFMGISNYGTPVDFCAPGTGLSSTKIGSTYAINTVGGTSFAAPHLAGILLIRGNIDIPVQGYVSGDPDGVTDPIPHL